jgi:5-oxopent-3-ene-1,2,5-tricarboxylate decarboxylase/2-hydroxyhepta-2,4-diene-1,7-dioate isomerase
VLGVKPRNTLAGEGASIEVPSQAAALQIGASLGIVIGRTACRVALERALDVVAGYTVVADISVPVESHYRPAVRLRARDGFCPISSTVLAGDRLVRSPDALAVQVLIDGVVAFEGNTADRLRGVAQLICDVTEFMTLEAGDLLLLGASAGSPSARAGQSFTITIQEVGQLGGRLVPEAGQ